MKAGKTIPKFPKLKGCLYHTLYIHITTEQLNIAAPEALWDPSRMESYKKKIAV